MQVRELLTDDDLKQSHPIMYQLRTHLSEADYLHRLAVMRQQSYRLLAAVDEQGNIVALAGFKIKQTLYAGINLHVDDLVTAADARSKGYGLALMNYIYRFAHDNGCDTVTLNSGVQRVDAHRFYEDKALMQQTGYAFHKDLTTNK